LAFEAAGVHEWVRLVHIDSVLVLPFWPQEDGARIELAHINVSDADFAGVRHGWEKYDWTPWRAFVMRGCAVSP